MQGYVVLIYPWSAKHSSSERLAQAVSHYTGHADYSPSHWETAHLTNGKPYFVNEPSIHFSLSHSGDYWACAFGAHPAGLDIQQHVPCRKESLVHRFFHPDEEMYLQSCHYRDFFTVWSAKESYVKYTGRGMIDGISNFAVTTQQALLSYVGNAQLRHLDFSSNYSLCICAEKIGGVTLIQNP